MDGTIGQDEKDLVLLGSALTLEQLEELTENRSKQSRATQSNLC